jgi:hypothetical protein
MSWVHGWKQGSVVHVGQVCVLCATWSFVLQWWSTCCSVLLSFSFLFLLLVFLLSFSSQGFLVAFLKVIKVNGMKRYMEGVEVEWKWRWKWSPIFERYTWQLDGKSALDPHAR